MTFFLPLETWLRLVIWLVVGLVIYFAYSRRHSLLTQHLLHEIKMPRDEETGTSLDPEVVGSEGEAVAEPPAGVAPPHRQNRNDRSSG